MIIDKISGLSQLSTQEKNELARELWEQAEADLSNPESQAQIRILNSRWKHYLANPETASTWSEVKDRLFSNPKS